MSAFNDYVRPLDREELRRSFRTAHPFPYIQIDDFLEPAFASDIARAYPSVDEAFRLGHSFSAVNERGKVQVTRRDDFPKSVQVLQDVLSDPQWLELLSYVSDIPNLRADDQLVGGGMHVMRSGAHLDVHVDFNLIEARRLHRRLNILVFWNADWDPAWGGHLELWDREVSRCEARFAPLHNRCVLFETSEFSYHGVERVSCPPEFARCSFAGYYYTTEAPQGWDGRRHSTVFRARPDEHLKRLILMPASRTARVASRAMRGLGRALGVDRSKEPGDSSQG